MLHVKRGGNLCLCVMWKRTCATCEEGRQSVSLCNVEKDVCYMSGGEQSLSTCNVEKDLCYMSRREQSVSLCNAEKNLCGRCGRRTQCLCVKRTIVCALVLWSKSKGLLKICETVMYISQKLNIKIRSRCPVLSCLQKLVFCHSRNLNQDLRTPT